MPFLSYLVPQTALITAMDDKVRATGEWQDRKSRAHSDASHEPQTLAELAALIGATEGEVAALDSFDFVRVMASLKLSLPTRAALQPLHARITSAAGSGVSESSLKWRKAVGAAADENRKAKHSQLRRAEFYRRVAGSDTLPPLKNADGNDTEVRLRLNRPPAGAPTSISTHHSGMRVPVNSSI